MVDIYVEGRSMNWEAIGAVGEVFGAIALVATLLYLGRQIGQTNRIASVHP